MITLTYTDEMVKQDALWQEEAEDQDTMKELFTQLYLEAWKKGFDGYVDISPGYREMLAGVYSSMHEFEQVRWGSLDSDGEVGYCKPLIDRLEKKLNGKE